MTQTRQQIRIGKREEVNVGNKREGRTKYAYVWFVMVDDELEQFIRDTIEADGEGNKSGLIRTMIRSTQKFKDWRTAKKQR